MEETHSEWLLHAHRTLKELRSQGMNVESITIDIEELVAWYQEQGLLLNSAVRSRYAAEKIRELQKSLLEWPHRISCLNILPFITSSIPKFIRSSPLSKFLCQQFF